MLRSEEATPGSVPTMENPEPSTARNMSKFGPSWTEKVPVQSGAAAPGHGRGACRRPSVLIHTSEAIRGTQFSRSEATFQSSTLVCMGDSQLAANESRIGGLSPVREARISGNYLKPADAA
jgi:hypothetical protein